MKILVLGGSPKGETSVTMQYVRWLKENLPGHDITTLQIASRILVLERKDPEFKAVIDAVHGADAVLWAFPLYVFTVCSQYKRFIELVSERGAGEAFRGKYAASLSTSIHFFDHTAHEYIRGVAEDLGMFFTGSFSPKMGDLHKLECRKQLITFAEELITAAEKKIVIPRRTAPLPNRAPDFPMPDTGKPEEFHRPSELVGKKVLVLVDYPELVIGAMAKRFADQARLEGFQVEMMSLNEMDIKGGCLGCLKCGQSNHCAYEGKDGFIENFRSKVLGADLLVFAGTIKDRALSARWKTFFDRSFFNTHQQVLQGKQLVYLIAGPLSFLGNLRETLQAYVEWQGANLVDFVSDEVSSASELNSVIDATAWRARVAVTSKTLRPSTFLGVAGMKIFRDDIFEELRIVFKGDHRTYKREGIYDFPQRKPIKRVIIWLGYWITSIPWVYKKMARNFPSIMIKQFDHVFAKSKQTVK